MPTKKKVEPKKDSATKACDKANLEQDVIESLIKHMNYNFREVEDCLDDTHSKIPNIRYAAYSALIISIINTILLLCHK